MEFAAAWFGGAVGVVVSHPFDTLRTQQAVNGESWSALLKKTETRSLSHLYRGFMSPCVSVGVWKAVTLGAHRNISLAACRLTGSSRIEQLPMLWINLSAMLSGAIGAAVCTPFDLIKARTMLRGSTVGTGLVGAVVAELQQLSSLVKESGSLSRNLFRGIGLMVLRDVIGTPCFLGSYEYLHRLACHRLHLEGVASAALAGAIAGPIGWICCYPIEVVKINWQSGQCREVWGSPQACARGLYHSGGVAAFSRGLPLCCVRSSLQISVTMAVFECIVGHGHT